MRLFHRNFMDIDLLSKMVRELILVHDRVALPGLGTFVADTVPASFSDKGYTINPPYRKLSFRQGADDDGLLADLYASENSVSREIASAVISDFLSGMKEVLEKKKNMVFPGLGRLRATKENNFFFVADEDLDIYPDGFGLAPVSLKTHQETKEEVSSALDVLKDMIVEPVDDSAGPAEPEDYAVEPEDTEAEENAGTPVEEACQADVQADASDDTEDADAGESSSSAAADDIPGPDTDSVPDDAAETGDAGKSVDEHVKTADSPSAGGLHAGKRKVLYGVLIVLAAAVLMLVLYMVVARIFPEAVDSLLYSPDEYELLHTPDE